MQDEESHEAWAKDKDEHAVLTALTEALRFFKLRDQMNAKVHLSSPRWSPITIAMRDGMEAWRRLHPQEEADG